MFFCFARLVSGASGSESWRRARQPLPEGRDFATGSPAGAAREGVQPLAEGNGQREETQGGGTRHAQAPDVRFDIEPLVYEQILKTCGSLFSAKNYVIDNQVKMTK